MSNRSKMGMTIALIFSAVAFGLALYDIFSPASPVTHTAGAYFIGLLTLLAVIFSVGMYGAKSVAPGVLNILCIITAGIIAIFVGLYWILICLMVSLIGCIIQKAGNTSAL